MNTPLVIYHGGYCLDGFGSAYAAYHFFKLTQSIDAEYFPANHGEAPPPYDGRDVYLLDFSYKRATTSAICKTAKRVVVLDHHISAQKDLDTLDNEHANLELVFDMNRSGAVITWDYFHTTPAPRLLELIQDRDLWQHRLPDSQYINAALASYPLDFELWRTFAQSAVALENLINDGKAICRYRDQIIQHHVKSAVMGKVAGHSVPIVNAPMAITSELLNELANNQPFAAGYRDKGTKRGWSLRSKPEGLDVSEIAVQFGGGGHARAAGFSTQTPEGLLAVAPEILA